jgi:4-hydroxyacetophenone monooxygenase
MELGSDEETPSRSAIENAIADADLRILLMCLVHMTADPKWLEAPYQPKRDIRIVPNPSAGLPTAVQEEVRSAVVNLLTEGPLVPAIIEPSEELMTRMMSVCLGEDVPPEYAPMMLSEMGLRSRPSPPRHHRDEASGNDRPEVVIVGAGASGIALGRELTVRGIPYVVIEKNRDVGGTWYENRYPGAGVDTPSHAYSFSYGPRNNWSAFFAKREEVHAYLRSFASASGVLDRVQFSREVVGGEWDEDAAEWRVTVSAPAGQETVRCRVLVSAIGPLPTPRIPTIPGLDSFEGQSFHAARWPDDVHLEGRRVAVIGTGATAMQVVPSIANLVETLTVYQRSPGWVRPVDGYNELMPPGARWLMTNVPFYGAWYRFTLIWRFGDGLLETLRKDPEWPYPERSVNRRNDLHRQELTRFVQRALAERRDLIEKCVPSYPPFGKRILLDNGWYASLLRDNVELVTDGIELIEPAGIVTDDGRTRPTDVIVFATGFHVTKLTAALNIRGRNGRDLAEAWADDNPTAYLGMLVPEFPNLFCMIGPNSALGHGGSIIFQAECQARYIAQCLDLMTERGMAIIEVRPEVHREYIHRVDAEHERLIWTHPGMTNWYRNRHGRIVAIMPWRLVDYWHMTARPERDNFLFADG